MQRATGGRPSIYIRDVAHNQRLQQVQLGRAALWPTFQLLFTSSSIHYSRSQLQHEEHS
jgi:hypothetical protein